MQADISIIVDIDELGWQTMKDNGMSDKEIQQELCREIFNRVSHGSDKLIDNVSFPEIVEVTE